MIIKQHKNFRRIHQYTNILSLRYPFSTCCDITSVMTYNKTAYLDINDDGSSAQHMTYIISKLKYNIKYDINSLQQLQNHRLHPTIEICNINIII